MSGARIFGARIIGAGIIGVQAFCASLRKPRTPKGERRRPAPYCATCRSSPSARTSSRPERPIRFANSSLCVTKKRSKERAPQRPGAATRRVLPSPYGGIPVKLTLGIQAAKGRTTSVPANATILDFHASRCVKRMRTHSAARQHFLYFFPLPQGQGSLRPMLRLGFSAGLTGSASSSSSKTARASSASSMGLSPRSANSARRSSALR